MKTYLYFICFCLMGFGFAQLLDDYLYLYDFIYPTMIFIGIYFFLFLKIFSEYLKEK